MMFDVLFKNVLDSNCEQAKNNATWQSECLHTVLDSLYYYLQHDV